MSTSVARNRQINLKSEAENCQKTADIFKVLGDCGRIKIVKLLVKGELCAGDIAQALKTDNTTISHQLKHLKYYGILSSRKDGKFVYYKIENACVKKLLDYVDTFVGQCK